MIASFSQRLSEVGSYFENGDYHLGYRRLLDAAIETNNFEVYEHTLHFCDWYDTAGDKASVNPAIYEKVKDILTVIQNGYTEPGVKQPVVKLKAENISKKYSRGNFSLAQIDVDLVESKIVGLVGENGNGKTTLLRLLYGELKPDTGNIQYQFSNEVAVGSFYNTKSLLAFIPQRPLAWYGSLMNNLQYASTFVGLKDRQNYLWTEMIVARMGLRPFRTYNWSRISSGYKMRFELARTLVKKPEVLLLDEPLANLDVLAQQIILEDLRFLAQSRSMPLSIILSSQQLYEVEKVSDQVIFLQKGVAQYQHIGKETATQEMPLIIELETTASRERLQSLLETRGLQKLSFNGGVYIMYFDASGNMADVLSAIGEAGLPVKYIRDISVSSRRFFDA